jgi:2'-5' RNA ligase
MHLTLRFLGVVAVKQIPALSESLQQALQDINSFGVRCERLGVFPDLRYPRVVWAWVDDEEGHLQRLQSRVDQAVGPFAAEPSEKRFTGHVTLARIRQIKRPEAGIIKEFVEARKSTVFGQWTVNRVSLMQSELRPEGAVHTEVAGFELREVGRS